MWRRKQKVYKDPRLYFVNQRGDYVTEYLPPVYSKIQNWYSTMYVKGRVRLGRDVYYYHVRHFYENPADRKILDIEFINHVIAEHNQEPEDKIERRHFRWLWSNYGHEINFIARELVKDENSDGQDLESNKTHPYARAYIKRWFFKSEPEAKTLYHGISWAEFIELEDLLETRIRQYKNAAAKKGLTPKTGKKLPKDKPTRKHKPSALK